MDAFGRGTLAAARNHRLPGRLDHAGPGRLPHAPGLRRQSGAGNRNALVRGLYEEIARHGGGILATVRATRAMDESQLLAASLPRLQALAAEGVTTVEIKSGYGLTLADELKMLRVARRLAEHVPVNISTTLLAAHALPPEFAGRADDYVTHICDEMIRPPRPKRLADAVDVFCERIAFSPAQCERVFAAAVRHGLPVKGHFEQLSNLGGARLAARSRPSRRTTSSISMRRACGDCRSGHGGRAAARCVLLPPRDAEAAGGRASRGRRADGRGQRPEPRHLSAWRRCGWR